MLGVEHLLNSSSDESDPECSGNEDDNCETNVFINHLRKAFISIDDTSYCESVMLPDLRIFNKQTPECLATRVSEIDSKSILTKRIDANSYEYVAVNKIKNQHRSVATLNAKLSEIKQENKNKTLPMYTKTGHEKIKFEAKQCPDVFDYKSIISAVSDQLQNQTPNVESNHFLSYMKFEAHIQDPSQTQRIKIFLPMSAKKNEAIQVSVYKSAKVSDLIGLICCKYTLECKMPELKWDSVGKYLLKIADDTGEIEEEFSCLEASNFVGKFGFTDLALVEKDGQIMEDRAESLKKVKIKVTIHFTDDTPDHVFEFDTPNVTMLNIFEQLCEIKKTNIFCPNIKYRLEYVDEPGIIVEQTACLSSFKKHEFYFFRENSVRKSSSIRSSFEVTNEQPDMLLNEITDITQMILDTSEFNVTYLSKWTKVQFKIGLSKDQIELEEINAGHFGIGQKKTSNFYSIQMKNVVSCEVFRESHKAQLRIVILEDPVLYKHLDFECDLQVAEAIRSKCANLMLFINSVNVHGFDPEMCRTTKWSRKLYQSNRKNSKF